MAIFDFRGRAARQRRAAPSRASAPKPIAAVDELVGAFDGRELWPAEPTGLDGLEGLEGPSALQSPRSIAS